MKNARNIGHQFTIIGSTTWKIWDLHERNWHADNLFVKIATKPAPASEQGLKLVSAERY
jgi:hypothetical protein